jgi:hypothetical protein
VVGVAERRVEEVQLAADLRTEKTEFAFGAEALHEERARANGQPICPERTPVWFEEFS